ncbi:hypothetical protein C1646_772327, partial [Rhizophagus diaphanus]
TSEVNINNINASEPRSTVRNIFSPILINETTIYEEHNSEDFWKGKLNFDEYREDITVEDSIAIDVRSAQKVKETNNITLFNAFHMDPTAILPSNAKAARKLLDSMQIPHILYKQIFIIKYNQIHYIFYHRTIYDTIKELLSNKDIFSHCVFDYMPKYIENARGEKERCYGEQYSSEW